MLQLEPSIVPEVFTQRRHCSEPEPYSRHGGASGRGSRSSASPPAPPPPSRHRPIRERTRTGRPRAPGSSLVIGRDGRSPARCAATPSMAACPATPACQSDSVVGRAAHHLPDRIASAGAPFGSRPAATGSRPPGPATLTGVRLHLRDWLIGLHGRAGAGSEPGRHVGVPGRGESASRHRSRRCPSVLSSTNWRLIGVFARRRGR